MSRGRILLVEDSPQDAELVLRALARRDLADEVLHLADGAEALDFLHRRGRYAQRSEADPAIVLLDLKMPRLGGIDVLRDLKTSGDLATIPVVVLSSSAEPADVRSAYRLGANAYVVKPMKYPDFVAAVEQIGAFWAELNQPPI